MKTILATLLCGCVAFSAQAALYSINIGTAPNDGTGDPLRVAMQKINSNFVALAQDSAQSSSNLMTWANGRFVIPNASEWGNIEADPFGRTRLRLANRPTIAAGLLATNRLLFFAPDPEGLDTPLLATTQVQVQDLEWLAGLTNTPAVIAAAAAREEIIAWQTGGPLLLWPGFSTGEQFQLSTNDDGKALEFVTKGSEPGEWYTNLSVLRGGGVAVQGPFTVNGVAVSTGQGLTTLQTNSVNVSTGATTLNLIAGANVTLLSTNRGSTNDLQISAAGSAVEASDGVAYDTFESYAEGTNVSFSGGSGWDGPGVLVGDGGVITRSLSAGRTDRRLELRGGQFARKLAWGNQWKRLFVVLLCRVNVTNNFTQNWFAAGVCSGTNHLMNSATTDNFVGFGSGAGSGWTYTTGLVANYVANGLHRPSYKTNTTWILTSTTGSTGNKISATETIRSVWVVEINRAAATNYTAWCVSPDVARVENDIGFNTVLGVMTGNDPTSNIYGLGAINGGNEFASWTWNESGGGLDTFNVGWTNALAPLEISAVIVRRCW